MQGSKVVVINSTLFQNTSGGGGAIAGTDVTIQHSTVFQNKSTFGIAAAGGVAASTLNITHSIIARNLTLTTNDNNAVSDVTITTASTSKGFNLFGIAPPANFTIVGSDQAGSVGAKINPLFGQPQPNGGETFTMALLVGGPAINAGDTVVTPAITGDQRGYARLVGSKIDIGAFEVQTGNGVLDLAVGTGPGIATEVVVFDGVTLIPQARIAPFESAFTGGVFVAAGGHQLRWCGGTRHHARHRRRTASAGLQWQGLRSARRLHRHRGSELPRRRSATSTAIHGAMWSWRRAMCSCR